MVISFDAGYYFTIKQKLYIIFMYNLLTLVGLSYKQVVAFLCCFMILFDFVYKSDKIYLEST
jgi:hypothetical protein